MVRAASVEIPKGYPFAKLCVKIAVVNYLSVCVGIGVIYPSAAFVK